MNFKLPLFLESIVRQTTQQLRTTPIVVVLQAFLSVAFSRFQPLIC